MTSPSLGKGACASCHVDGRDDGLTWKTPSGPRRTRLLAGELKVGPYGWTGANTTLDDHVKKTIENLGGKGLPDDERASLESYVTSLPALARATKTDRGKEIFAKADCGACHVEGRSDRMGHDVGTGGSFLTPTLAGVGTRRELMHDGRYKDLEELLAGANQMGKASLLAEDDRRALARYLETL